MKNGKKILNLFFVFLTLADSEFTFANWQHYQCFQPLKREETLFLLNLPKFRFSLPSYTKSYSSSPTLDLILDRQNHRFCDFCLIIFRELMCLASPWESSE